MPVPFYIPPWLTPPDPVQTYQRGVQIGAQIGESQARMRLSAENAAREQQQREYEATLAEQRLQLQASEAAQRTQAQLRFRANVAAGMDPMQALMESPEIMSEGAPLAQMLRAEQARTAAANFQPSVVDIGGGQRAARLGPSHYQLVPPQLPETTEATPIMAGGRPTGYLQYGGKLLRPPVGKSLDAAKAEYTTKRIQRSKLQEQLDMMKDPKTGDINEAYKTRGAAIQKLIDEIDTRMEELLRQMQGDTQTAAPTGATRFIYDPNQGIVPKAP